MSVNFVTVGGNRPYGLQARWCVESIKYHYPDEGIFVAIPESETQSHQLPEGINTIQISQPVSDYNPSLKPAAIAEVERISDSNITIFVDPDVILLERLTLPDGELKAKPVNLNALWPKDKEKNG